MDAERSARGFSLIEVTVVVATAVILSAIAVPSIQRAVYGYRLRSAVASATGAIQATRYQAIMNGYPYAISLDPTTVSYQVSNQPPGATTFSNVGAAVPLSGSAVTVSTATTLQFKPNGMVQATVGQLSFSISYQGTSKTITVSSYGNVSVSP